MTKCIRVLIICGMSGGIVASQAGLRPFAAASEIRLRASQLQQLIDEDIAELAKQTQPPSQAEIQAVQLRLSHLRKLDVDTVEGLTELTNAIENPDDLAYIRKAAFTFLMEAEIRQLIQIDATTAGGQDDLLQVLRDADAPSLIRQAVIGHLANSKVRSADVQQVVLKLVSIHTETKLCRAAIYALDDLGAPAADAVAVLIPALDDHRNCHFKGCSRISDAAVDVLGAYGPAAADAIPWLAWKIDPANKRSGVDVTQSALGKIAPRQYPFFVYGDEAVAPLIEQLSSDISGRRLRAADRLLELHEFAGPAAVALEAALNDENHQVRATAAAAILAVKPHGEACAVLTQFAASTDRVDRARLVGWLSKYPLNFDDGELLLGFLSDTDPYIRSRAAIRLAKTDRHVSEALEAIVALYNLGGNDNQVAALHALGSFHPKLLGSARALVESAAAQEGSVGYLAQRLQRTKLPGDTDDSTAR